MTNSSKRTKKFAKSGQLAKVKKVGKKPSNSTISIKKKPFNKNEKEIKNNRKEASVEKKDSASSQATKAIEEMNVDDFMQGGFLNMVNDDSVDEDNILEEEDDDDEGEEDDDEELEVDEDDDEEMETSVPKKKDSKKKVSAKKAIDSDSEDEAGFTEADIEALKDNDPDFYKFLKHQDKNLLEFQDDEFDNIDENADDDDENDTSAENKAKMEFNGTMDEEGISAHVPILTGKMLNHLVDETVNKHSVKALRKLLLAFKEGCSNADTASEKSTRNPKYRIVKTAVFNKLMTSCIKDMHTVFSHHLSRQTGPLPSSSPSWKKLTAPVKSFIIDFVYFLTTSKDKTMIIYILTKMENYIPYLASLPVRHSRNVLKILLGIWSYNEDANVKILAFLRIRQMGMVCPFPFLELCMKGVYLTYVKNAKFVSESSLPSIILMRNCVVELYSIDAASSYQHAFVYIRQLAIQLRTALTSKTQESYKNVYNWQYVNCLKVWAQLLSSNVGEASLQPLLYPLVQVIIGTIRLIPTPRYFPLRLHCAETLIQLGESSSTFIPVAPILLSVFHCKELTSKTEMKGKPPVLALTLKFAKAQLENKSVLEALISRTLQLLALSFENHEYSIAFPELILPTLIQLRNFAKNTAIPHWKNACKALISKLESKALLISQKRSNVDFAPKDVESIANFQVAANADARRSKSLASSAKKEFSDALEIAKSASKTAQVAEEEDDEEDDDGEEEEDEDGEVDGEEEGEEGDDDEEDLVEDFAMSDDKS